MNKMFIAALLLLASAQALAQIPTTDAIAAGQRSANHLATMAEMASQLVQLKNQLEQAKAEYTALTGSRGLGSIAYSQGIKNLLPPEMHDVYSQSANAAFGISGSIAQIMETEKNRGSVREIQTAISDRQRMLGVTDKAIGIQAYDGAQQRLKQIESLMGQINQTSDPKAIAELQARIGIEQAAVGNEQAKLAVMGKMQENEQKLVQQQKRELSQKIMSNGNTTMPRIQ